MPLRTLVVLLLFSAVRLWIQANYGEVRLKIKDPAGAPVGATVELALSADGYEKPFNNAFQHNYFR